jgi:hypothetical protein
MRPPPQPFTEPWRTTALRTGSLALVAGAGIGLREQQVAVIPLMALLALWFTLGGHFLELLFRNRLRRQISDRSAIPVLARIVYWFAGGAVLFEGALATRALLIGRTTAPLSWWLVGIAFVGVELLIHVGLRARGHPSLFDGRG